MEYVKLNIILLLCFNIILLHSDSQALKKEAYMSVPKLISDAGYPSEKHRVTTSDGYILQMHRIPAGRRTGKRALGAKGKKAVFVLHGLLGSSGDFVIMGPERSLGYLLADAGYDVWLGNLRGTIYSAHQNLTRRDPEFWEYSIDEHGKYDLPAMIDKVLNVTGLQKVLFVGYSMGTTTFFTMIAHRPEYNDKVVAYVAMAPAVYLDNIRTTATFLLKTINVPKTMRERGLLSFTLRPEILEFIFGSMCTTRNAKENLCLNVIYSVIGEDYDQHDEELSQTAMARMQPASWRQLEHFGKIAITGVFTSWEDGLWGAVKPYNLSSLRVPVTILYGENDKLTAKPQIMRLAEELKKNGVLEDIRPGTSWPKFNHIDFVFAKDLGQLLNKPLIQHIKYLYNKYSTV